MSKTTIPLRPREKARFTLYLADCKEHYNSIDVETYGTYYEDARCVIEDYILWSTDRETWMRSTL